MTRICFYDTEDYCDVPISAGTDLYTRSAECLIVTYALDEQPTQLWEPWKDKVVPADFQAALDDPECLFIAHKSEFDFNILERALGIFIDRRRTRCTMAQAYSCGLPGSIGSLGAVLGIPEDLRKLVDDGKLIHTFCVPQKGDKKRIMPYDAPEDWERFCRYAVRDTDTLREIYRRLPKHNYLGLNLRWWYLNQLQNERGFGLDTQLAHDAREFLRLAKAQTDLAISAATGGAVQAATQRKRLLTYLQQKHGLEISNLRASEVRDWLEADDLNPEVRFLLETRLEAGKSSGSKYTRALNTVGPQSRMRWAIQWSGAGRTGRNSGRNFNPQNLPRPMIVVANERRDMEADNVVRGALRSEYGGSSSGTGENAALSAAQWSGGIPAGAGAPSRAPEEQQWLSDSSSLPGESAVREDCASVGGVAFPEGAAARGGSGSPGQGSGQLALAQSSVVNKVRKPEAGRVQLRLVPVKAKWIDEVILPGIRNHDALSCDIVFGGPHEAAALALRHVIVAAPGNELIVADWKNIESRVLAWLAGEEWKLRAYEANDRGTGADLYKLLFSQFFGTSIESVNDTERQAGKVCELAFGFGGGVGALVAMAATYQIDLDPLAGVVLPRATPERLAKAEREWRRAFLEGADYALEPDTYIACDILKQGYRASNAKIDQFKHDLGDAVKQAVRQPGAQGSSTVGRCKVWSTKSALLIELPSGRRLTYWNPRIEFGVRIDPETGYAMETQFITYWTARGKQWRKESSWPGLFVENVVQAVANDVLRAAAVAVHEDSLTMPAVVEYLATLPKWERTALSMDVHDELALDLPKGIYPVARLAAQCTKGFWWSAGLPLAVDTWVYPRYGKRG